MSELIDEIVATWIDDFQRWIDEAPAERSSPEGLFHSDSWWRDLVVLTGDIRTAHSSAAIADFARLYLSEGRIRDFILRPGSSPGRVEHQSMVWIEAIVEFRTDVATGRGVVRLTRDDAGNWRAWAFSTAINELIGHEAAIRNHRPLGVDRAHEGGPTWRDVRKNDCEYLDREPYVVIVGAGQNGLALAAQLSVRGIAALLLERNPRVGDNWRNRYESLVLHDPVWVNHFPFMPFPQSWPVYTPKDKLGDWLEHYATALDLNVWCGSTIRSAEYDDETKQWSIVVSRPDGGARTVHPVHVVMTTGNQGVPKVPENIEVADFAGRSYHSSQHSTAADSAGERVIVVGASTSAHDIAKDYHDHGAEVTMMQRSSAYVINQRHMPGITLNLYDEAGQPTDDADLLFASLPNRVLLGFAEEFTSRARAADQSLLDALAERGFTTDDGPNGTGLLGKVYQRGGGYYINVGCSELIAQGKIAINSGQVSRMVSTGIELVNGHILEADTVVFATGFSGTGEMATRLFGEEVIARSGLPGGLDDEGEVRRMFRRTGHPGLWFMGGSLHSARINSRYLALQLAALHFDVRV